MGTEALISAAETESLKLLYNMSGNSIRQRGGSKEKPLPASPPSSRDGKQNGSIEQTIEALPAPIKNEWDYKLALSVITALAFVTRFWGIGHPNEVVFDEVHFGKVYIPLHLAYRSIKTIQDVRYPDKMS